MNVKGTKKSNFISVSQALHICFLVVTLFKIMISSKYSSCHVTTVVVFVKQNTDLQILGKTVRFFLVCQIQVPVTQ